MEQDESGKKQASGSANRGKYGRQRGDTNVWAPDATTFKCPACGSRDTRKSFRKGLFDALMGMFNRWPYRCRSCNHRFIRKTPVDVPVESLPEPTEEQPE